MAPPLATIEDLEALLGRDLTAAEAARAPALLASASERVRAFTGQSFDPVVDDVVVLRPVGTLLRLPQRPVTAVTAVVAIGGQPTLPDVPLSGWTWDGADLVDIGGLDRVVVNLPEWWYDSGGPNTYRVTYSHGYATIPAFIVDLVAGMVLRTLTAPSMVEGLVSDQEQIGQYSHGYRLADPGSSGPSVRLTADDKQALIDAGYKPQATTVAITAH
jgi:hypothetical protein